ncbi:ABC transporter substrate-binding protein [Pendulispora albinea]|uniref:Uncharacterized protein n=1 Tax=Pendulispora albinea TaxID=2741071 RepID=A0ABZ2M324_9BACT
MRYASIRRVALAALLAAGAPSAVMAQQGCSFSTNTTAVQCTSEDECLALGPSFAGTTCDPLSRTCVRVPEDQGLCSTNKECIDKAGGVPAICRRRDRRCVTLASPECPTIMAEPGQVSNDDAIVIGAITPGGGDTELGDNMEAALHLAQIELSKVGGHGLPSISDRPEGRPLVIVACREFGPEGYESILRAADHLARDIEVPVNIGPVDSGSAAIVAAQVFNPRRILSILPSGKSSILATLANPVAPTPIIWSPSYGDREITNAAVKLVSKVLEPRIHAQGEPGPIRVAVLSEDNFLGQMSTSMLQDQLSFNGKSAVDNGAATPPNYLRLSIGDLLDPVGNPAPETKIAAAIRRVYEFKPHIIFHSYAPKAVAATFFPLVRNYPPATAGTPVPYHIDVVATFGAFQPLEEVIDNFSKPSIPAQARLRSRLFSAETRVVDRTRNDAWVIKFQNQFPRFATSSSPKTLLVQSWYDSAYMAAFAIVANGKKPLTGENLAATLPQLIPPGQQISPGPDDTQRAFGLLGSGQGIDLDGLSGNLNLDQRTGRTRYNISITCPNTGTNGKTQGFKDSGFYTENQEGVGNINHCD